MAPSCPHNKQINTKPTNNPPGRSVSSTRVRGRRRRSASSHGASNRPLARNVTGVLSKHENGRCDMHWSCFLQDIAQKMRAERQRDVDLSFLLHSPPGPGRFLSSSWGKKDTNKAQMVQELLRAWARNQKQGQSPRGLSQVKPKVRPLFAAGVNSEDEEKEFCGGRPQ